MCELSSRHTYVHVYVKCVVSPTCLFLLLSDLQKLLSTTVRPVSLPIGAVFVVAYRGCERTVGSLHAAAMHSARSRPKSVPHGSSLNLRLYPAPPTLTAPPLPRQARGMNLVNPSHVQYKSTPQAIHLCAPAPFLSMLQYHRAPSQHRQLL